MTDAVSHSRIDLAGQRFGRLVAEKPAGQTVRGAALWQFRCDCGEHITMTGAWVRQRGDLASCGCLARERRVSRAPDLTGQRYGRLIAVQRAESTPRGQARWICACDCGGSATVAACSLRSGRTRSCGCLHREAMSRLAEDHQGKRFGSLIAIRRLTPDAVPHGSSPRWLCACDCGAETTVRATALAHGQVRSCGCRRAAANRGPRRQSGEMLGKRFGMLVCAEILPAVTRNNGPRWRCTCDCGREHIARAKDLRSSNTKSCGCLAHRAAKPQPG